MVSLKVVGVHKSCPVSWSINGCADRFHVVTLGFDRLPVHVDPRLGWNTRLYTSNRRTSPLPLDATRVLSPKARATASAHPAPEEKTKVPLSLT